MRFAPATEMYTMCRTPAVRAASTRRRAFLRSGAVNDDAGAGHGIRHPFTRVEISGDVLDVVALTGATPADDAHSVPALPEPVDDE